MKEEHSFKKPIYITRPLLPSIKSLNKKLKEIWKSKCLTNMGYQHYCLEFELQKFLKVENLTLFCNGTLALQLAIQALNLKGEIITTPFTFPATVNCIIQNNIRPLFCDINLKNFNIDINLIEDLITPETTAILPVHVFGNPCEIEKIDKLAKKNNLKVIYDAAHCFGVEYKNQGIGTFGDISMFSFHSTKVFHTIEGGALTYKNSNLKEILNLLKNFGIKNAEEVILPGINAKMNEIQAAIGLLNLKLINHEIEKRKKLSKIYRENLVDIEGIHLLSVNENVKYNYQYFSILIDDKKFGINRDQIYNQMKKYNVFTRKYFYPLCTQYQFIKNKKINQIINATTVADQILCLPIYGEMTKNDINKICKLLINLKN